MLPTCYLVANTTQLTTTLHFPPHPRPPCQCCWGRVLRPTPWTVAKELKNSGLPPATIHEKLMFTVCPLLDGSLSGSPCTLQRGMMRVGDCTPLPRSEVRPHRCKLWGSDSRKSWFAPHMPQADTKDYLITSLMFSYKNTCTEDYTANRRTYDIKTENIMKEERGYEHTIHS